MSWLISPLAWLLLAGALAPWAGCHRRPWLVRTCGSLAALALAAMTPLGANGLAWSLERLVPVPYACQDAPPTTAVVLGGGIEGEPRDRADFSVLNLASRRRMDRAVAWWREREGRVLVVVGGPADRGVPAVAELMAEYAGMLGVPSTVMRVESDSDDTWGNARQAAGLLPPLPRRLVLVTSLIHMPRAQEAFASAGFEVCPLGTDVRRLPARLPWALVPRTSALANTEIALHEWLGLVYYRWLARQVA